MRTPHLIAVLLAVALAIGPVGASATQKKDQHEQDRRDGQSRHEGEFLTHVPLVLSSEESLRIASIVMVSQTLTFLSLTSLGVDTVSQDRIGLGGLGVLGGLFNETYGPDDFGAENDVGTVFRASDDKLVIALKGDLKLEDYKVVIFNRDNEYQVRGQPTIEELPAETLAKFGSIPVVSQLMLHTITPNAMDLLTALNMDPAADQASAQDAGVDLLTELPALQDHVVGRAYLGPNNTLMVLVRPALVAGDEGY